MAFWVAVPLVYLAAVTVPLIVADVRALRLPNALVLPGLVLLVWALLVAALRVPPDALAGLAGAAAVAGVLGLGWAAGLLGMGDVKVGVWLGGMAGMMGMPERPDAVAHGVVVGGVLVGAQVVASLAGGAPFAGARIPLGPPLLAAFWAAALTLAR